MSHAVEIATTFFNWEALKKALDKLNWSIKEKTKIRTYGSDPKRHEIFDYVAVHPSSDGYDMGVKINPTDGQISFIWDSFNGSIERSLGRGFNKLKVAYAEALIDEHYDETEIAEETSDYIIIEAESH